jgi:acyl-CoA thioesterase FadM
MKPPSIPLEKITALMPLYRITVPETFLDENGHMNVRYYLHVFDDAGYPFVAQFGLTPQYHQQHNTGGFDLEHHIHYPADLAAKIEAVLWRDQALDWAAPVCGIMSA